MPLTLTPDQLKSLGMTQDSNNVIAPANPMAIDPRQKAALDQDEGGITRQPEAQIFDGSTYTQPDDHANLPATSGLAPKKSVWDNILESATMAAQGPFAPDPHDTATANLPENKALYNSVGEQGPLGTRIQKATDPETGSKSTYIVPPPGMSPVQRVVGGGAEQAVQGVGSLAEWAVKNMPDTVPLLGQLKYSLKLADSLGQPGISDQHINWINENMPRVPAQNDMERMGQEITSMAIGGLAGQELATAATKLGPVDAGIAKLAAAFYSKQKALDPTNAVAATQAFIKSSLIEMAGTNTGASVTAAPDTKSLTGQMVLKPMGVDQNTADHVGNFLDNTLATTLLKGLGMIGAGGKKIVGETMFAQTAGKERDPLHTIKNAVNRIDPDMAGAPEADWNRRAKILGETVLNNADPNIKSFPDLPQRQPTEALGAQNAAGDTGARQYVEQAYDFMKAKMDPAQWNTWADNKAAQIQNNISQFRRENLADPNNFVMGADAKMAEGVSKGLSNAANTLADKGKIVGGVAKLAQGPIDAVSADTNKVLAAQQAQAAADADLRSAAKGNNIAVAAQKASETNPFGQTLDQSAERNNMVQSVIKGGANERQAVNAKFEAIPSGYKDYNQEKIANLINNLHEPDDVAKLLRSPSADVTGIQPKPEYTTAQRFAGEASPKKQTLTKLDNFDLKDLYTRVRPRLSDMIDSIEKGGGDAVEGQKEKLIALKDAIDNEVEKSDVPQAYTDAMDAYKKYKGTYEGVGPMSDLQKTAKADSLHNYDNALMQGRQSLENALGGQADTSGKLLEHWSNALAAAGDPAAQTKLAANAVDHALQSIHAAANGNANGLVTAQHIVDAVKPYANTIKQLDPKAFQSLEDARTLLQTKQDGLAAASTGVDEAVKASRDHLAELQHDIGMKFAAKNGHVPIGPTEDYGSVFKSVFSSADETKKLMAKTAGDKETEEAIQAQYLKQLGDDWFTPRPLSAQPGGGYTREFSGNKLNKAGSEANPTPQSVKDIVFEHNPQMKSDLDLLQKEAQLSSDSRAVRPQTFSSNTSVDNVRQKALQSVVAATLGILNRTATIANRVISFGTGAAMERDKAMRDYIVPNMLVNPTFLSDSINSVVKDSSQGNIDRIARQLVTPSNKNPIVKGAVTAIKPETTKQDKVNYETDKAFKNHVKS